MRPRPKLNPGCSRFAVMASLIAFTLIGSGCERSRQALEITGVTMATQYAVTVVEPRQTDAVALKRRIDARLAAINAVMSTYDPDSELSRLNANASTDWISVSDSLHAVLAAARAIGRESGGTFDVTVGPLVNLWGFGPEERDGVPGDDEIDIAMRRVGLDKFELRGVPKSLRKRRGDITIDLSGIAKGYAVDEIAGMLEAQGETDYLVEIGGELRANGQNRTGNPWRIGIENPLSGIRDIGRAVPLTNTGMASSGTYRNFFDVDGVRYSHMIDPKSGWPVRDSLAGVTVIHRSAMIADAWATALMTLGLERAQKIAAAKNVAALFFSVAADNPKSVPNAAFNAAIGKK